MDKRITNLKCGVKRLLTHFSELLQQVRRGERITITHHGVPVAMLVSASPAPSEPVQKVIENIKAFRRGRSLGIRIKELIDEGRA
ncbi:MAG: type II toxin-antitoxin system Phd/YefM family antitoxin [Chloroflexota bacterium]